MRDLIACPRPAAVARAGVRASYADDEMKDRLAKQIDEWLEEDG